MENTGSGEKHGLWKTRGLVENTGSQWKTLGASEKHVGTILSQLGGKRGAGVQGPGLRGPRVWKTRGVVENTGSQWKHGV